MSMNVYISAERKAKTIKTGKLFVDVSRFNCWQTPTDVTYKIIESDDPAQEYRDYIMSITKEEFIDVYAPDDVFGERDPVDTERYHVGEEHIAGFNEWLESVKDFDKISYDAI